MKPANEYGPAVRNWEQQCRALCNRLYGITDPDQLVSIYTDTLLARSAPSENLANMYQVFWLASRIRDEALRIARSGEQTVPEELVRLYGEEETPERMADHIARKWMTDLSELHFERLRGFPARMRSVRTSRPFMSTTAGLGLGCPGMQAGAGIYVLYGTVVLYVLRPRPNGAMTFVGDVYVQGTMNGEAPRSQYREGRDEVICIR
ncbi:hypothetical protein VTI28DRAFT_3045 [Corynascus sepedonium]